MIVIFLLFLVVVYSLIAAHMVNSVESAIAKPGPIGKPTYTAQSAHARQAS